MNISWLGLSCFKIQGKAGNREVVVVTDPFDSSVGIKLPRNLSADIVTVSHHHEPHNNIEAVAGIDNARPFVIDSPGEYETKGVFVYGIDSAHGETKNGVKNPNTIMRVEMEDITIAHLGDLGVAPSPAALEKLEDVDILFIPVGGVTTIGAKNVSSIVSDIEPRIVIPMHYRLPELKIKLDGLDGFLKEMGLPKGETMPKLKISKKDLQGEETKIVILERD